MSVTLAPVVGTAITIMNPDLEDKLDLDPHQVVQPKASGGFYRFALAAATDTVRDLRWTNLPASQLSALQNFFESVVQGTLDEFTFTDERGTHYPAYFLNPTLEPITVADEQSGAAGTFACGGVNIPTTTRANGWYEVAIKLHLGPARTNATTESPTTFSPTTAGPSAGPTTGGATEAATTEPLSADFTVADAGTSAANGGFFAAGTLNGYPYYLREGGGAFIWAQTTAGQWAIGPQLGNPASVWYFSAAFGSSPDGLPYDVYTGNGTSPAPAVSVG